jgi:hypothetical protein
MTNISNPAPNWLLDQWGVDYGGSQATRAPVLSIPPKGAMLDVVRRLRAKLKQQEKYKPITTRVNPRTGKVETVAGVDNSMQRQAELIAAGLLDPQMAEINRAIAAKERQEIARGKAFEGVSEALAKYTAGIPGGIQAAYQGAADRTAGYGSGLSGALGEAASGAARQAGETLAAIGPTGGPGVTSEGGAIANTTNYLGGFLPAADLAAEGASRFTEASTLRMAGGARLAEEALASMRATREETEELRMRGLDLERTRPAEIQKALKDMRAEDREERTMKLQERAFQVQVGELQLARAKTAFDQAQAMTNLTGYVHVVKKGKVVRTKEVASGSDAFTSAQTQINQNARTAATQAGQDRRAAATRKLTAANNAAKLGLSEREYDLAVRREERLSKGTAKKGGFTPQQKQKHRGIVNDVIMRAVEDNKLPKDVVKKALAEGVPYTTIVTVMRNWARRNKRQDWLDALNAWQR